VFNQGEVSLAYPKHRDKGMLYNFPLADKPFLPPIQGGLQIVNISKRKTDADGSFVSSPFSYNLTSQRR
jgi:hypothetical protein